MANSYICKAALVVLRGLKSDPRYRIGTQNCNQQAPNHQSTAFVNKRLPSLPPILNENSSVDRRFEERGLAPDEHPLLTDDRMV